MAVMTTRWFMGPLLAALLVLPASGLAQTQGGVEQRVSVERVRAALELPRAASGVRARGVPEAEVREALDAMREREVPAGEAVEVLDSEARASEVHGPLDNFGAFVRGRLDEGLRGRALADAIRAEHQGAGRGAPPEGTGRGARPEERARGGEMRDLREQLRDAQRVGREGRAPTPGAREGTGEARGRSGPGVIQRPGARPIPGVRRPGGAEPEDDGRRDDERQDDERQDDERQDDARDERRVPGRRGR
jgi:hypothetical protein